MKINNYEKETQTRYSRSIILPSYDFNYSIINMVRKELEVSSCRECPFANIDFEYGYNSCNHPDSDIELEDYIELPERTVHKECPLLDEDITIKLL